MSQYKHPWCDKERLMSVNVLTHTIIKQHGIQEKSAAYQDPYCGRYPMR